MNYSFNIKSTYTGMMSDHYEVCSFDNKLMGTICRSDVETDDIFTYDAFFAMLPGDDDWHDTEFATFGEALDFLIREFKS
jgi:hypothetical protein